MHQVLQKLNSSKSLCLFLYFLIFLWGMVLRCDRFERREIGGDELYQLRYAVGPFQPFWERKSWGDCTCYPGDYLVTYPFLKLFGLHTIANTVVPVYTFGHLEKWLLISPHILSTILGFYFLYLLGRRYFKTLWGFLIAASIFSFHHDLIFHSLELRPYAVLQTLPFATLYFCDKAVCNFGSLATFKKFLLGLFFIFVILFHAYGILIFGCCAAFALLYHREKSEVKTNFKNIFIFFAVVFLIALPIYFWYASGDPYSTFGTNQSRFNTFDYISNPLQNAVAFLKAILGNLFGNKKFYFLLAGIPIAAFLSYPEKRPQIFFFLVAVVLPIELIFLMDVLRGYWFLQRQFVWVVSLFAFFLGWVWDTVIYTLTNPKK